MFRWWSRGSLCLEEAGPTDLIRIQGNNELESKPIN